MKKQNIYLFDDVMLIDTKTQKFNMLDIKNRRFMYNTKTGTLILGCEGTVKNNGLISSHTDEHAVSKATEPFDSFIRGWIGKGGKYPHGVIQFTPAISKDAPIDLFNNAFDTLKMFVRNKAAKRTVVRGFGEEWEQLITSVIVPPSQKQNPIDRRYYKINIFGQEQIFTNVQKFDTFYLANTTSKMGVVDKFEHKLSPEQINSAEISIYPQFLENPNEYVFKAYMVNAAEYDNGNKETSGTWIYFPATDEEINAAFEETGLSTGADSGTYFFDDYVCSNDTIKQFLQLDCSVSELQNAAVVLKSLEEYQILKLNAVMETDAVPENLEQLTELAANIDYFTLDENVSNAKELGQYIINSSGIFSGIARIYKDAIEPETFGKNIISAEQGVFTSKGYLSLSGDEWKPVHLQNYRPKKLKNKEQKEIIDKPTSIRSRLKQSKEKSTPSKPKHKEKCL